MVERMTMPHEHVLAKWSSAPDSVAGTSTGVVDSNMAASWQLGVVSVAGTSRLYHLMLQVASIFHRRAPRSSLAAIFAERKSEHSPAVIIVGSPPHLRTASACFTFGARRRH